MARSREEYLKAKRESAARHRAADPERFRKLQRDWYAKNGEKQKSKFRAYYSKRFFWGRAMKLRGKERATTREISLLWKKQRGRCGLTGRRLNRTAQLDHILPKGRGGGDGIENLRWVCDIVNIAKRDSTDAEFLDLCRDVINTCN